MSEIKAIEKLREFVDDQFVTSGQSYLQGMAIVNSIEAEIADRYMPLPVDVDGVPIHVGDYLQLGESRGHVIALTYCPCNELPWEWQCDSDGDWYNTAFAHHAKPRTVEDVLRDVWKEALDYAKSDMWRSPDEVFAERADELRDLMGSDA